jgi:hypothetical protein
MLNSTELFSLCKSFQCYDPSRPSHDIESVDVPAQSEGVLQAAMHTSDFTATALGVSEMANLGIHF